MTDPSTIKFKVEKLEALGKMKKAYDVMRDYIFEDLYENNPHEEMEEAKKEARSDGYDEGYDQGLAEASN